MNKRIFQLASLTAYFTSLTLPAWVFFGARGSFIFSLPVRSQLQLLFPLFGLYAFTLVSLQASIGPNVNYLRQYWPRIRDFHRIQGLFAFLFMWLHPISIAVSFGLSGYFQFISGGLKLLVLPAYAGLTILTISITTAFLTWRGMNLPWWRRIHRFNYLAFVLVWIHSWFIGSDVRTSPLRYLWLVYLGIVSVSVVRRYVIPHLKPAPTSNT